MRICIIVLAVFLQTSHINAQQQGVVERGDNVMGFSHEQTTHHFRLFEDGGEIAVTANEPSDKVSVD